MLLRKWKIILFLCICTCASQAQQRARFSDLRKSVWLKSGNRIAFLTDADTIRLAEFNTRQPNETERYGILFKKERITGFDTTSILCAGRQIPFRSLRAIYRDKKYLGWKIPGIVLTLASTALIFTTIRVDYSQPWFVENKEMLIGISGIMLGGYLTFHNYNPLVKWETPYQIRYVMK